MRYELWFPAQQRWRFSTPGRIHLPSPSFWKSGHTGHKQFFPHFFPPFPSLSQFSDVKAKQQLGALAINCKRSTTPSLEVLVFFLHLAKNIRKQLEMHISIFFQNYCMWRITTAIKLAACLPIWKRTHTRDKYKNYHSFWWEHCYKLNCKEQLPIMFTTVPANCT